jgi:hypothetical protein
MTMRTTLVAPSFPLATALELLIVLENDTVVSYMSTLVLANSYCKFEFPTATPGKYTALIGYTLNGFGVDIIELLELG